MRSNFRCKRREVIGKRIDWITMLCAAFFTLQSSLFTSCRQEDDIVEIVPSRHWVDKRVAVVAPLGDAIMKTRLERTTEWFIENFREAQRHDTLAINLQIEWYDEFSEDLATLSDSLANREDIVAVIGPFANDHIAAFAPACRTTQKPLIAPTATSEDIIRRYATTSTGLTTNARPFLWSLTETDVSFTSLLMSSYALLNSYSEGAIIPRAALFSPDNEYGKTFNYWAPFYALEDDITMMCNEQYTSSDDLIDRIEANRATFAEEHGSWSTATFCVVESAQQMYDVARTNRKAVLTDPMLSFIFESADPEDPVNDKYWQVFSTAFQTYFAFADLNEESLEALGPRVGAMLQGYNGFSPYADPTTGFEQSYLERFGVFPTFAECKFYDALMLVGFAACYNEHQGLPAENAQMNAAILAVTNTADAPMSGPAWNVTPMQLYLSAMESGQLYHFVGASGDISFDAQTFTASTATTYVYWQILDGKIIHRNYFGSTGNAHTSNAKAAWIFLYNEQRASDDFQRQASGGTDNRFLYPMLTDQYAVLVQGSDGFANYRHQADVLSIYQSLRRGGYPDDHIILILDKNMAYGPKNPEPGVVRTSPSGPDLLSGTTEGSGIPAAVIDYDNADLTAADVAEILAGHQSDRLPIVVPQDEGHNVLLYWSGHGRPTTRDGINEFCWLNTRPGEGFTTDILRQTAQQMKFRKLLITAEPCYGESVIRAIEGIPGVLAISGANSEEQSWADSWSDLAGIWMCDRFSKNLVNCLSANPDTNFRDLFLYCAQHTLGSHARIVNADNYGNLFTTGPAEFIRYNHYN